jgi:hypothetical protein
VRIRAGLAAACAAATVVVLVAILSVPRPTLAAAKPPVPFDIFAGAWAKPDKDAPAPRVKLVRSSVKGLNVTVEHAPPGRRAEFLKTIAADIEDPFATPAGRPDRVVAFIVTFRNEGREQAVFNPGNVAIVTDKNERLFPLDMTDMYMSAERQGVEDLQAVIDRSSQVLFDSSTVIPTATGLARLVVFRPIEGKWKQFRVHFSHLQVGRETHTLSFTFHKQEEKG